MMKLNEAIPRGRIEHVREAIARGADLNPPTAQDGMTPLLHAAAGHAAVVRELLAAGAGSNRADTRTLSRAEASALCRPDLRCGVIRVLTSE